MTFLFLVASLGCNSDSTIQHPIEITGYLDPARMELTSRTQVSAEDTATIAVAGRPGATTSTDPLLIQNTRTKDEVDADPTADGGFWASIDARAADEIQISQEGAEAVSLTVEPFESLPEREVSVHLSDDHTRAEVTVTFVGGLDAGWIVSMANPSVSLIVDLEPSGDAGTGFQGEISADPSSVLELYATTPDGLTTLSVGIEVPAA
jgi:hypothetical protein